MKFGSAFSDTVVVEKKTSTRFPSARHAWWMGSGRALIFSTVLCVSFFILLFRLFSLTVIHGSSYRLLADGNRTRELIRHAPRGLLLDRTGKPLVANIPQYRLLKPCLEKTGELCTQHISRADGEKLSEKGLPAGWFLEIEYQRQYLYPEETAHVVGYTGELSAQELTDEYYAIRKYRAGDRIGRTGAEAIFEERLRGRDGKELIEIDATGKMVRVLGTDREVPGETITLSLDAELSQTSYQAFPSGKKGAIIVSKPKTGEILSLYSSPTFSLNAFSLGMNEGDYLSLMNNKDLPLFNRAIGGVYPPGSTFKIVTSIASLEEGAIDKHTLIEDTGVITLGQFSFPNWYFLQYGRKEGILDIVRAISRSNDIFFYKAGEKLGITKLADWAKKIGIGKPLGIELPGEATGLMPDPVWKNLNFVSAEDRQARNNLWFTGDTYHVAIGQGYLLTTPLQVNAWTNVIANGGKVCKPTIEKVKSEDLKAKSCKDLGIKKDTIDIISEGMKGACTTGGTGWPFFNFSITKPDQLEGTSSGSVRQISVPVACKTGTAEFGDPMRDATHAWFTAFAPLPAEALAKEGGTEASSVITGEPEISVTVLVEDAGEGSDVAAPVAKKIFETWFKR